MMSGVHGPGHPPSSLPREQRQGVAKHRSESRRAHRDGLRVAGLAHALGPVATGGFYASRRGVFS